jgi:S1-C subfamily serine protease
MGYAIAVQNEGVRVVQVVPGGNADLSGLHVGDLILEANGHRWTASDPKSLDDLLNALSATTAASPAAPVHLVILRNGSGMQLDLTLHNSLIGPTPPRPLPPVPPEPPAFPNQPPFIKLGVVYDVVTPQLAADHHLGVDQGALVQQVLPNSPAALAGIMPGDIITAVDGDKVDAKRTLAYRMIPYMPGDTFTLTVVRGSDTLSISVTLASGGTAGVTLL